ncbi:MAG: hypothetical protein ACYCY6_01605 [Minisyncoccota bacterium]
MRFRILSTIFLSFILIIGAVWFRADKEKIEVSLVSVDNTDQYSGGSFIPNDVSDLNDYGFEEELDSTLTTTDLMSRQLLTDYMNLARTGGATEENIQALASKYVEGVSALSPSPAITIADLNIVSNTKNNFERYDELTTIIERTKINEIEANNIHDVTSITPENIPYNSMMKMGIAYEKAANALTNMDVPASLAALHVKIVNNYLSTSSGLFAISESENDSAMAFAGIAAASTSMRDEGLIIDQIIAILVKNGL